MSYKSLTTGANAAAEVRRRATMILYMIAI